MQTIKKHSVFFTIGGVGYGIVECIWRGYTHWTMLIAGGVCAVLIDIIEDKKRHRSLFVKAGLCSAAITSVELLFGLIFNKLLHMNVWDYSQLPLNFMGQICPLYSLLWMGLSMLILPLIRVLDRKLGANP